MPSPRYGRLPAARRAQILEVAQRHLVHGADAASYNQIIADAGISKTTAYLYFDGKADLVAEVGRDLMTRLGAVLGPWTAAGSARGFWRQLGDQSEALRRHLVANPDDLALLGQSLAFAADSSLDAWVAAMVDDGVALGVIRDDLPRPLLLAATIAVLRVVDEHAITAMMRGEPFELESGWQLLRGLWGAPIARARKGKS